MQCCFKVQWFLHHQELGVAILPTSIYQESSHIETVVQLIHMIVAICLLAEAFDSDTLWLHAC